MVTVYRNTDLNREARSARRLFVKRLKADPNLTDAQRKIRMGFEIVINGNGVVLRLETVDGYDSYTVAL